MDVNWGQDCKQCRSRWDGSWWAVSSGSTLFVIEYVLVYRVERVCLTRIVLPAVLYFDSGNENRMHMRKTEASLCGKVNCCKYSNTKDKWRQTWHSIWYQLDIDTSKKAGYFSANIDWSCWSIVKFMLSCLVFSAITVFLFLFIIMWNDQRVNGMQTYSKMK